MPNNIATELDKYREYLGLLVRLQLDERLMGKVDVSGVVQLTLLEASQASCRELQGENRIAWLRRIFANNLLNEIRRFRTQARDVEREWSLEQAMKQSASRFNDFRACDQSTPSQNAIRAEAAIRLAKQMKRTKEAIATSIFRGITQMRELLCTIRSNTDV